MTRRARHGRASVMVIKERQCRSQQGLGRYIIIIRRIVGRLSGLQRRWSVGSRIPLDR
jgi:hypothetical protein